MGVAAAGVGYRRFTTSFYKVCPQQGFVVSVVDEGKGEVLAFAGTIGLFLAVYQFRISACRPYFEDVAQLESKVGYGDLAVGAGVYAPVHICAEGYAGRFIGLRPVHIFLAARCEQSCEENRQHEIKIVLFHFLLFLNL